jgi:amino acid adenylation domain-containing protein
MHDEETPEAGSGPDGWVNAEAVPAAAPVLTDVERHRLIHEWNATTLELPDACVHELFERQVKAAPDAVAVVFGEQRLTYRQLNQSANRVAHYLRKRGVGPETLVGVSLERNPNLVVSLLGVWKAGGAYVPLDTTYPAERLSFMVEDSGIRVLLTEERCRHLYPGFADKMVCVDADWAAIARESPANPKAGAVPSNLAYVMYTSGSTGRPKGAMILHGGLVNYLTWAIKTYALEAGGSVPVHTSVSFDLSVTSLYPALLSGGQVELLTETVAAQSLLAALRRGRDRNLVKITPAHLDLLGQQLGPHEVAGLTRLFVIGGENLPAESLQLWRDFAPHTRLINEYGPTETVVGCCVYEVREDDPRNGPVPIGRPIANTRLYVLDADLQPVPVGVMGELYVGGAGVARGYLNRPELTRERFVQDPFCGQPGARMYKTGDLARYRPDGVLEYLGRVDDQVKVRGYRIELGEIEAAVAGHPAVKSCVVVLREDTPGSKQLAAYVVARPGQSPAGADLQDFAKTRLPDYMVPGQFVLLDSLPLTNNGKVDRRALPQPAALAAPSATTYRAPRSPTEGDLTEIWQRLLQRDRIGTRDDFFDAGGHSMLMLALLSETRDKLGVELELATVLQYPTIESLAAAIDAMAGPAEPVVSAPQKPHPWLTELRGGGPQFMFFVYDGDGELLPYMNLARRMPAEFAVWGISPFRLPGIPLAHLTIPEMARHCVQNLQLRQPRGPYFLGGLCAGGEIAFEAARQLEEQGEVVEAVILLDAIQPTTPHRPWLQSLRRWRRFVAVFDGRNAPLTSARPSDQSTSAGPAVSGHSWRMPLTEAAVKVRNVVRYEAMHTVDSAWIYARQQLLKRVLASGSAWPPWLPSLSVRDIYNLCARANYRPGTVRAHVVLVKAGEGEGAAERGSELVADPFLGWKEYAVGRLDVIDAPGGHSGMLQEPNVETLVGELVGLIESGSRDPAHEARSVAPSPPLR